MKKISLLLLIILLFCNCSLGKYNQFYGMTPEEVGEWIYENIEYKKDGIYQNWQLPSVTLKKRTGDCEDFSLLFIQICYEIGYGEGILIVYSCNESNLQHVSGKLIDYNYEFYIHPSCAEIVNTIPRKLALSIASIK